MNDDCQNRAKPLPTLERLLERLAYEPETGRITFRYCPSMGKRWNTRFSGKLAFQRNSNGYKHGKLDGVVYQAHRIAWKMATGQEPDVIDHLNGVRSDNRLCNLRNGTQSDNMLSFACRMRAEKEGRVYNRKRRLGAGVRIHQGAWVAWIYSEGHRKYLGRFKCWGAAILARRAALEGLE